MPARKACMPAYPAQARGEDMAVTQAIIAAGRVALLDAPWLYTYVQTGANTWQAGHFEAIWQAASLVARGEGYEAVLAAAAALGPHLGYARVCLAQQRTWPDAY